MFHGQCFATLLRITRTDVSTVSATQTVENINLDTECHTVEYFTYCFQLFELSTLLFFCIENERTDRSVRTNVSTLVTLDTVFRIPFRNESCHTAFFVLSRTLFPSTVFDTLERRYFQQVAVLCVDRTNHFVDECRVVVFCFGVVSEVSPSRVNGELRQKSNTALLITSIGQILEELTGGMTLLPGTIIATGTPAGVGMGFDPPRFLQSGDTVECAIEGIGTLCSTVI